MYTGIHGRPGLANAGTTIRGPDGHVHTRRPYARGGGGGNMRMHGSCPPLVSACPAICMPSLHTPACAPAPALSLSLGIPSHAAAPKPCSCTRQHRRHCGDEGGGGDGDNDNGSDGSGSNGTAHGSVLPLIRRQTPTQSQMPTLPPTQSLETVAHVLGAAVLRRTAATALRACAAARPCRRLQSPHQLPHLPQTLRPRLFMPA